MTMAEHWPAIRRGEMAWAETKAIDLTAEPESGLIDYQQLAASKHFSPWATELSAQKCLSQKLAIIETC